MAEESTGSGTTTIVECPHCGVRLEIPPKGLGRVHRCRCGGEFRAPGGKPPRPLPSPRDAVDRLAPKWKAAITALLGVVILVVVLHVVQAVRWHIAITDPAAPVIGPPPKPSMRELLSQLADEETSVRGYASKKLAEHGARAIKPLIGVLRSDDGRVHTAARAALVSIGEPAVPALLKALANEDIGVASSAARALGQIGDPRAIQPLIDGFGRHLAAAHSRESPPQNDRDQRRKHYLAACAMAGALGELRAIKATYPLLMAVGTGHGGLNPTIAEALESIGPIALPVLKEHLWQVRPEAREIIINVTTDLEAPLPEEDLLRLLKSAEHRVSLAAARALVGRGDKRVLPVLIGAIEEDWPEGVSASIGLLGELGDVRAVPAILPALKHKSNHVRERAAESLGELGHRDAVEPLIAALEDRVDTVVKKVMEALGKIGDKRAFEPLVAVLETGNFWIARPAARALGALGDPRAIGPLIDKLVEKDANCDGDVCDALVALGPAAAPPLVELLGHEDDDARYDASRALSDMKADALDAILAGLETANPEGRRLILTRLRVLSHEHPRAQEAVEEFGPSAAPSQSRTLAPVDN